MIRILMTTTALAAFLTTGVLAQEAPPPNNTQPPAVEAPANGVPPANEMASDNAVAPAENAMSNAGNAMENAGNAMGNAVEGAGNTVENAGNAMQGGGAAAPMDMAQGYTAAAGDTFTSRMVGSDVYSSPGEDAEVVGSINDLVINAEGRIAAVVIGVGGFLGIGEKNVAVDFSQIQMTPAEDGSVRLVLPTTAEALTAAPDFVYPEDAEAEGDAAATDGAEAEGDAAATDDAAANGMAAGGMAAGGMAAGGAAAGEQAAAGAGIDRSTLTPLDMSSVTAENLIGTAVYGANDEQVGTIGDFVMSADGGQIDAVIIDVGGFLGIGVKEVAVGFENLQFSTDENNNRYLFLNVTREQLDAQPAFNRDTFQTDRDAQLLTAS